MILSAGGTRFRVHEIRGDGWTVLEHCSTKDKKKIQTGALLSQLGGAVQLVTGATDAGVTGEADSVEEVIARLPLDMHSPAQIAVLKSKMRWISALAAKGLSHRASIEEIELQQLVVQPTLPKETQFFGARTIKEDWRAFAKTGDDPRVLLPNFSQRGGPATPRISEISESLLRKRIEAARKRNEPYRPLDLQEEHIIDVTAWNANPQNPKTEPASDATIHRRFHAAFGAYEIASKNIGKTIADRDFRESGVRIRADIPLLAAQFDDTDGEVFLVDDETGLPWGRAFLTLGIDECTGSILGKSISESYRNVWSASNALIDAILPKNMADPDYALTQEPWYAYGKLGIVQFDNAMYNRSAAFLEGVIADAMALPGWSKPRTPTGKSQIENLNDIIKEDFTPTLPGWRGPKRERDGLESGPGTSVMSLQQYRQCFNTWACDRYANRPRERGFSPKQLWDRHFKGKEPRMPMDTQGFRLIATKRETLSFRASGGLLRKGLRYKSDALSALRARLGKNAPVQVRVHPFDLSRIYVFNPELKVFLVVPCVEQLGYLRGLTDYQQSLVLKLCRETGTKNPTLVECNKAKERLREIARQLRNSKKLSDRRRGMQMSQGTATDHVATPNSSAQAPQQIVETDLESRIRALSEIPLADNDEGYQDDAAA
jgi:Mu transposase, C-terminal